MPLKILLADDSMTAQKMGKEILTAAGYEVIAVSNGAVAAKKLVDKPDIIILDVFMPGYSGLELCEKIRASMDLAKTPVLLTVGKMEPYRAEDGQKVKADGVIIKPFEASDLLAAVQKLADKIVEDAKPKSKSGAYEKTMIFKAPQIIEEFKDESYAEWKIEADKAPDSAEGAAPLPMQMSSEMGAAPAFGADMMSEPAAAPAFDMSAPVASAEPEMTSASPAPAFEIGGPSVEAAAPAAPIDENLAFAQRLSGDASRKARTISQIEAGAAIAAAAANAPEPAFDLPAPVAVPESASVESQSFEALLERVSEPSSKAAVSAAPEMELSGAQSVGEVEITPDPGLDRGEASYTMRTQDPALETDPTKMVTEFPTKFGTSDPEVTSEGPDPAPAAANSDFDARVAAAMSGYDTGIEEQESAQNSAANAPDEVATTAAAPEYEDTQKIEAPAGAVDEVSPSQEPPKGMHDAELVEQMQAAFANLPVETAPHEEHAEPVTQAVEAASPAAPAATTTGPDLELASALAAAVGADAPPATATSAEASSAVGDDQSRVVTRVLERMLPSIMAELAKEMEAAKKK